MPKEKSVGAVVFREEKGERLFLLLRHTAGHWSFPKGHIEKNETEMQTVEREIEEETGLKSLQFFPGFMQHTSYFFKRGNETIFKEVTFFLAKAGDSKVRLSSEHRAFEWLPFKEALERICFKDMQSVLSAANYFLNASR